MEELNPAAAQCHAEFLRRVLKHAHRDSNVALQDLAEARHALGYAAQPDFRYVDLGADSMPRTIPAAQFHRQYALCLRTLELTIYGYCIERQFGWERKTEMAFSTRRPAFWRRLLRPAPFLAFKVKAELGAASISIGAAQRAAYANKSNYIVRLDPAMQQELAQINTEQTVARSLKTRLFAWIGDWRKQRS